MKLLDFNLKNQYITIGCVFLWFWFVVVVSLVFYLVITFWVNIDVF